MRAISGTTTTVVRSRSRERSSHTGTQSTSGTYPKRSVSVRQPQQIQKPAKTPIVDIDLYKPSVSEIEAEFSRHINFHSFAAYMGQFKILDMTLMALTTMRDCFEEDCHHPGMGNFGGVHEAYEALHASGVLEDPARVARIKIQSCLVSAAAMWILVNGSNLFTELVQFPRQISTELLDDQFVANGRRYDGPVVGLERWSFWRKGFENAARGEAGGVEDECAQLAAKAAKGMAVLEEIMWH